MLSTKNLYMKACMQSKELHAMTEDERLKLQEHLRKMYLEIEKVCDRHNLRMCAGYGNVLGALRHQGFIPWDDDMDLLMPREDYDKFIRAFCNELPDNYKIYAPNCKNGTITRFAKVVDTNTRFICPDGEDIDKCGIFIDIFPLEESSKNKISIFIKHKVCCALMLIASSVGQYQGSKKQNSLYKKLMCSTNGGRRTYRIRHFIGFIFHFFDYQKWNDIFDRFSSCSKLKSGYIAPSGGADKKYHTPVSRDIYFPAHKMKYDDIEIYVPNNPEVHCELEYGDWHWIPPVEERWQHFIKEIRFKA